MITNLFHNISSPSLVVPAPLNGKCFKSCCSAAFFSMWHINYSAREQQQTERLPIGPAKIFSFCSPRARHEKEKKTVRLPRSPFLPSVEQEEQSSEKRRKQNSVETRDILLPLSTSPDGVTGHEKGALRTGFCRRTS